jgi:uncharacterized protein (TIGR00369 family)
VNLIQLPRTSGCLVCGRDNPIGLRLTSFVDPDTGIVAQDFTPRGDHIGFQGVIHGGILATVLDEAMVWAATWHGKRFCLAAELCVRFRKPAEIGRLMKVTAKVEAARSKLILTTGQMHDGDKLIAEATAKYIPLPPEENAAFVATLVHEPAAEEAFRLLGGKS